MNRVAIKRSGAYRRALYHACASAGEGCFLLGGKNTTPGNWKEARDRLTLTGNYIFFAGLDLADAAGKSLIGFTQAYRLGHSHSGYK
jgi:hypothetical protein